jgi:hypothetical protein
MATKKISELDAKTSLAGTEELLINDGGTSKKTTAANLVASSLDGAVVINESGADVDFRIESDTNTHALFVDAGNNRVGILNSSPATALDVTGTVTADGLTVDGNSRINGDFTIDTAPRGYSFASTLEIGSGGTLACAGNSNLSLLSNVYLGTDAQYKAIITGLYGATHALYNGKHYFYTSTDSGTAGSTVTLYERMRIANNGDISFYEDTGTTPKFFWDASAESLGIGTSSPDALLHLDASSDGRVARFGSGTSDTGGMYVTHNSGSTRSFEVSADNILILDADRSNARASSMLQFNVDGSERMRIDSSGNVMVGTTGGNVSDDASGSGGINLHEGTVRAARNGAQSLDINRIGSDGEIARFRRDGSTVGSISVTGSATAYNTSSDYRLKEDWQPMSGSIDRLKALNPVNFAWKVDGSRVDGFLAHEAAEVVPEAVSGEKDAVEAIGNVTDAEGTVVQENVLEPAELAEGQTWTKTEDRPVYQGIDQSKLVPLLTAALQEAVSKIEALETRIATLEGA